MKHNEGQNSMKGAPAADSARQTRPPEFPPLQWIHVIYDQGDDAEELEHELESAPPMHRSASMHPAFPAK